MEEYLFFGKRKEYTIKSLASPADHRPDKYNEKAMDTAIIRFMVNLSNDTGIFFAIKRHKYIKVPYIIA